MRLIALRTKGKFINFNELSPEKLKNELLNETPLFLGTEHGKNIREVYPSAATPVYGNFSVAGISGAGNAEMTLLFGYGNSVEKRLKVKLDAKGAAGNWNARKIWAQKKVAELDLDYEKNKAELTKIGREFGIVTRSTSLIVLETISDYRFYGIKLPPDLQVKQDKGAADTGWGAEGLMNSLKRSGGAGGSGFLDNGVFAADIDKMLQSLGSPKQGGGNGTGRKGGQGVAGAERKSGTGGLELKKKGGRDVSWADHMSGRSYITGGRSSADIQRVFLKNKNELRIANQRRKCENPGLFGKIWVKFAINECGMVIFAYVVESTTKDIVFDSTVVAMVKNWDFGIIDKPGDVTEFTYPFVIYEENCYGWSSRAQSALKMEVEREKQVKVCTERLEKENARRELEKLRERVIGRNILKEAADAADRIRKWQNTDFTRTAQKYSAPDKMDNAAGADSLERFKDNVYFKDTTGSTEGDYQLYLKIREGYAASPEFYFDMANWFYTRGDKETALRVLTSIADLELENAGNYRMLGYRLKEYGEYALEKYVCGKVLQWRPAELHNHLDYALALSDNGEAQAALDSLCSMLKRPFPENFRGFERDGIRDVAVMELNRLIAKNPRLNVSKVDRRLLANVASDIRVVVRWNTDGSDINLAVKNPNGEWCHYYNYRGCSETGWYISDRILIATGYGPEQYLLKKAEKGKYLICVNYINDGRRPVAERTTVAVDIYRKYAGKAEQRQTVSRQVLRDTARVYWTGHDYRLGDSARVVAEVIVD
jgi:hypothetical protein